MPDRRLFDSTSLTTPPEPRSESMTSNVEIKDGDVFITGVVIVLCAVCAGAVALAVGIFRMDRAARRKESE